MILSNIIMQRQTNIYKEIEFLKVEARSTAVMSSPHIITTMT